MTSTSYKVGHWIVEPGLDRIRHAATVRNLRPQVMNILEFMAVHPGEVISTEQFLADLWQGKVVTSSSVYNCLNELRAALGDDPSNPQYLETIPKRGYRLIAPVSQIESSLPKPDSHDELTRQMLTWRFSATALLIMLFVSVLTILGQRAPEPGKQNISAASIAILPFSDLSPAGDQSFFSDGLTEEVINLLGNYPGVQVTGRSSSFAFRNHDRDLRQVGSELGVAYLLEGSVRREKDHVRVSAHLVNAANGYHLWSEQFDRDTNEIFSIQDEIARNITDKLAMTIMTEADDGWIISQASTTVSAYDLYLLALRRVRNPSVESLTEAISMLNGALKEDNRYTKAHILLAETYLRLSEFNGYYGNFPAQHAVIDARPHVRFALGATDNQADALAVQGLMLLKDNKPDQAEHSLLRALELNPSHANALLWLSKAISRQLRPWTEEIEVLEKLVEIDPAWTEPGLRLAVRLGNIPGKQARSWALLERYRQYAPGAEEISATEFTLLWQEGRLADLLSSWQRTDYANDSLASLAFYPVVSWYALAEFGQASQIDAAIRPHQDLLVLPLETAREGLQIIGEVYLAGVSPRGEAQITYECIHVDLADLARTLFSELTPTREQFINRYRSLFATQYSPALTMAWLKRTAGDEVAAREFAEMEREALRIRSGDGAIMNAEFHQTSALLETLLGNEHEALTHLQWLAEQGPLSPILLLHPVFGDMHATPGFEAMLAVRERRINAEREKLGLPQQPSVAGEFAATSP